MTDVRAEFEGATSEDVKAAVAVLRDILRERKTTDKAAADAVKAEAEVVGRAAVADLDEGDAVLVTFRGAETEATFVKVTDKRFTVEIDGERKSIMFAKFVGAVVDGAEAVEAEELGEAV